MAPLEYQQYSSNHAGISSGHASHRLQKKHPQIYEDPPQYTQQAAAAPPFQQHQPDYRPKYQNMGNQAYPPSHASQSRSSDGENSDSEILEQALDFTKAVPLSHSIIAPLSRPLAIPQTSHGRGKPFSRIWAPELQNQAIAEKEFLEFIDNLNVVATANIPLQVLNLAGSIVGMVPHHWFQLAGLAVQATAAAGTAAVTKGRTEMYMKKVNQNYFAPRRLRARIASSEEMSLTLGIPLDEPLVTPLSTDSVTVSSQERKLNAVRPYMPDITLDVPPPSEQTTALAKMSAGQVERQSKRYEKNVQKNRRKMLEESELDPYTGQPVPYTQQSKYLKESRKLDKEVDKVNRKANKELSKGKDSLEKIERERNKEMGKIEKDRRKLDKEFKEKENEDDKEAEKAPKTLWILIENLEAFN
jgi:hypothetical protein